MKNLFQNSFITAGFWFDPDPSCSDWVSLQLLHRPRTGPHKTGECPSSIAMCRQTGVNFYSASQTVFSCSAWKLRHCHHRTNFHPNHQTWKPSSLLLLHLGLSNSILTILFLFVSSPSIFTGTPVAGITVCQVGRIFDRYKSVLLVCQNTLKDHLVKVQEPGH